MLPEYLPFKYTSFPVNAARQTYRLTTALATALQAAADAHRTGQLPPILTFQSLVDTTVRSDAVVHELYDRLDAGSELVLFDVNRQSQITTFFRAGAEGELPAPPRPYRLTVVTNAASTTLEVVERSTVAGGRPPVVRPLGLAWPPTVFSLTHIALPFPQSDSGLRHRRARCGVDRPAPGRPGTARRAPAADRPGRAVHAPVVQPVLPVSRDAPARVADSLKSRKGLQS